MVELTDNMINGHARRHVRMHALTLKHKHIHTHEHIHTYTESGIYKAFIQSLSTYVQYICIYSISIYNFVYS